MRIGTADCQWISPPLLARKTPPAIFRFALYLRGPNYATVKNDFMMPTLEEELTNLSSSKFFAKLDFAQSLAIAFSYTTAFILAFRGVCSATECVTRIGGSCEDVRRF
jgi:hypothetical protein